MLSGPYFSSANSPPLSPLSNSNPKDVHVLSELIRSMESFNFGGDDSPVSAGKYYSSSGSTSSKFLREEQRINVVDDDVSVNPDFGWVNDLLM